MYCYEMGRVVGELRKRAGISQEELAFNICTSSTISRIENGTETPSKRLMDGIITKLEYDSVFFYGFFRCRGAFGNG